MCWVRVLLWAFVYILSVCSSVSCSSSGTKALPDPSAPTTDTPTVLDSVDVVTPAPDAFLDTQPVSDAVDPPPDTNPPSDAAQVDACAPICADKTCGDDGCGGLCGTCPEGQACTGGHCVCTPNCFGKTCGDDGCGGLCGTCPEGQTCNGANCACTPQCAGKNCGDDGCGGLCGTCPGGQTCNGANCVCTPQCAGKNCGSDGCGGLCGTCPGGQTCNGANCVCTPQCAGKSCGSDGCGGLCGTCPPGQSCSGNQCQGETLPAMTFSTNSAAAGVPLLVWVKDTKGWVYIGLQATGPCGTEDVPWNGVTESNGVFTWEFALTPAAPGAYSLAFTADNGTTTVVANSLTVAGSGSCAQSGTVCTAAGAACSDEYPESKVCASTGVAQVVTCHKFGTCSGVGDGTLCSWGAGSYCDDPCAGQDPSTPPANKFGIGLVGPGNPLELDLAKDLAGDGGKVLLIFPGVQKWTTGPEASWVAGVQGSYDRNLVPVVRIGPPWGQMNIRDQSDDPNHLQYKGLAQAYRAVVEGLPLKPNWPLYIQVHNEPNLCHEWVCAGGGTLGATTIAAEYAAFFRDVADAIHAIGDPRIRVSLGALAPGGNQTCNCCGNGSCGGAPGWTGLQFLDAMKAAVPDIWTRLDYLASHPYPASNIGWGFFLPFDQSGPGLHYFELELAKVGSDLEVMITETGWSTQRPEGGPFPTEQQKADWTVQAYQSVWLAKPSVVGVMPFILMDQFWGEQEGFGWTHLDGTHYPVFDSVRAYRCSLGLGPC